MKTQIKVWALGLMLMTTWMSCEDDMVEKKAETIKPVANFKVEAELFKEGEKIVFTDLSTDEDGFIVRREWDFGDGTDLSTDEIAEHFYLIGGTYEVKLTVTDNTGSLSDAASQMVEIAKDTSDRVEPEIVWTYALPAVIDHCSPAVSDDHTVFIGVKHSDAVREVEDGNGNLPPNMFAVNGGAKVWETLLQEGTKSDRILTSPAIADDGSLYMASFYSREIFHLNSGSGLIEGKFDTNARHRYSSPVFAADGSVYLGGYSKDGKGVYSLTPSLGASNWVFKLGEAVHSTPAIGEDGTIYVSTEEDFVYAINPDGTEKWSSEYGTWAATAIALGPDGTVYFAGENGDAGVLIAYNAADGTEKWRNVLPAKANHGGPAIAPDGTVYLGGYEEEMKAYNPATGAELWSYTAKGAIEAVPAIDNDGNLYFGDLAGFFHVINSSGEKAWKESKLGDLINSSAAIGSDGLIYVAVNEGEVSKLVALKTKATGLASGGWPMFAKNAKHTGR
jgi:outer membrane protein assembly factor BamB